MTTQELKNKIEKVLGNSIRCLLPSYWWKNLFHSVADRIDEVETTVTENVSDMVVKSLKEFEAKHPDMASSTLVFTSDSNSVEARSNYIKIMRWVAKMNSSPAKSAVNPLYVAVPIVDEDFAYSIQTPMYGLGAQGVKFYNLRMPDGKTYNLDFDFFSGVAKVEEASSSSGGGSVMFVADPLGNLTEEQKQNNADAYLKVIEAEGTIDINIMVIFFIAKPNMVSVDNNGNLVLVAAGTDGGATKFIFTPEGDVTVETVESSSGGVEIRDLHISQLSQNGQISQETQLTDEQKAWNLETIELVKQKKAIAAVNVNSVSILLQAHMEIPAMLWGYVGDDDEDLAIWVIYDAQGNTNVDVGLRKPIDFEMSDTSENAVQNKVIKNYVDNIKEEILSEVVNTEEVIAIAFSESIKKFDNVHESINEVKERTTGTLVININRNDGTFTIDDSNVSNVYNARVLINGLSDNSSIIYSRSSPRPIFSDLIIGSFSFSCYETHTIENDILTSIQYKCHVTLNYETGTVKSIVGTETSTKLNSDNITYNIKSINLLNDEVISSREFNIPITNVESI